MRLRFQFLAAVELLEVDGRADDYRVVADKNRRVVVVNRHILDCVFLDPNVLNVELTGDDIDVAVQAACATEGLSELRAAIVAHHEG